MKRGKADVACGVWLLQFWLILSISPVQSQLIRSVTRDPTIASVRLKATIAADPRGATAGWIAATGSKLPLEVAARVLNKPGTNWSLTPKNVMKFTDFMAHAGMIASAPASWRDLYFPEDVSHRPGG